MLRRVKVHKIQLSSIASKARTSGVNQAKFGKDSYAADEDLDLPAPQRSKAQRNSLDNYGERKAAQY